MRSRRDAAWLIEAAQTPNDTQSARVLKLLEEKERLEESILLCSGSCTYDGLTDQKVRATEEQ